MSQLDIYLLGAPRIECDGTPIEVDTRKAIALLAFLAVTGEAHRRDTLSTLLWPDADETRARGALRRTLSSLRSALGGDWLSVSRDLIELRRTATLRIDIAEFQELLRQPPPESSGADDAGSRWPAPVARAVGLYRGDFMAGFSLRDSPEFDDWQNLQAEWLRRELIGGLQLLAGWNAEAGELEEAISYGHRWLAADPLAEEAHRRLMLLYAQSGERAAALRQYQDCVRILDDELGVAPSDETSALYQRILADDVPRVPRRMTSAAPSSIPGSSGPQSHPRAFPLVGRANELRLLGQTLAAVGPDGRIALVEGEAGVGKTYLVEAFLDSVVARGARSVTIRGYEGEQHLAYGPIVEALRGIVESRDVATLSAVLPRHVLLEIRRLMPQVAPDDVEPGELPPLDSPGAQARFFNAVWKFFQHAMCGDRPGVLFVDDAQWIDHASFDLLGYIARRLRDRTFMLILCWRPEQASGVESIEHLFAGPERDGLGVRITVGRLGEADVRALVSASLGDNPNANEDWLVQHLLRETEGLPLFLSEYLSALTSGASPAEDVIDGTLPRTIRDLILARFTGLSDAERQLLMTAAVFGRSFDWEILRQAGGLSEDATVNGLESLLARGLLVEVRPRSPNDAAAADYDFNHHKVRSIVYDEMSLARRRLAHSRVADALAARGQETHRYQAAHLAYHLLHARRVREAADQFVEAGNQARTLFANAEALSHFQAALDHGHPNAAWLHEVIGDLHTLSGCYDQAILSYQLAAEQTAGSRANLDHKLGNVYLRLGKWKSAERHFEQAAVLARESDDAADRGDVVSILTGWSFAAHRGGDQERGWALGTQALDLAASAHDDEGLARAHNVLGMLARSRGDLALARHHVEESLDLVRDRSDLSARTAALNNLALVSADEGDLDSAIRLAHQALDCCVRQGDRHREAAIYSNLADFLHSAGQDRDALDYVRRSVEIYAEINVVAGEMQPGVWQLVEW